MHVPNLNGILIVNKPVGLTSHDVVNVVRRMTHLTKVGHAGTLDPIATGVLPVCIGVATKITGMLQDADKVYRAELVLGMTTDTYDCEGEVLTECEVTCTKKQIIDTILDFQGEQEQIPPMYSAIKQNGKKLYELARQGVEVARKPRKINISAISVLNIDMENYTVEIEVECSKGTYIRTLCHDIGLKLGVGAYMNKLERVKSYSFTIDNSYTLQEVRELIKSHKLQEKLINVENIFKGYPKLYLTPRQAFSVRNGCQITWPDAVEGMRYRLYSKKNNFLCISECKKKRLVLVQSFWNEENMRK
ncbi:MAG TPA: tRNA pseudouridine(55) synthase TruB [Candidatus Ornithomonoglobus intestinigallinarum]|uniref:tRNA pseudouridine synthase B n=1 Tax=Candidatus Ornithomonoglobus intestinigallinarum TaxID=2840894 RepID=A0A9D1H2Y6_9FIRM|nr:tRNA pseudouridine(55) synthase TruB [Candidatus Ornithomonoglobus intestinigallinarum]